VTTTIADHMQIQSIPPDGFHPHVNSRPFAIAGFDQTVECAGSNGSPVTLNGSASGDQDSDILTYEWADSLGNMVGASAIATAVAQIGTQTYTLNVTDPSGLSATAQTHVTVRDITPPVLTLTKNIVTVFPTVAGLGASVDLSSIASATDICDPHPTITNDAPANSFFPIGTTTVTFTATDHSGNSSQKKITVQVLCGVVIDVSPSTVPRGGTITVGAKVISCASTTQTVVVQFTLTGPLRSNACTSSKSIMFTTPPFTLAAGTQRTVSFPFKVPSKLCPGAYSITATTLVNGTAVNTSTASVTVTP